MNSTFRFRTRFARYLLAAVVAGVLLYRVAPILSPFLFATIPACICLPMVDRLPPRVARRLAASIVPALAAFPASAALLVDLRDLRVRYLASDRYKS